MRVAGWRADGITGNSVVLIRCVTNLIILIRNSRPVVTPIHNDNDSFLTNRRQGVRINGFFSFWKEVLSGIPQGSIF